VTPAAIEDWTLTSLREKSDQDRREGRQSWTLRHLPDGRGSDAARPVLGTSAADRSPSAAPGSHADVRPALVIASRTPRRGDLRPNEQVVGSFALGPPERCSRDRQRRRRKPRTVRIWPEEGNRAANWPAIWGIPA
jgi:hypothetical protein